MSKLLYLETSPRKARSVSITIAKSFLDAYTIEHPDTEIDTLDLENFSLPEFDENAINAKFAVLQGQNHTPEQEQIWGEFQSIITRFTSADIYLLSVPMWNFTIPYRLKHFIDVITQPGLTFTYSPDEGYQGLVTGKTAIVVYARGGAYPSGTPDADFDFQKPYLEFWLNFIGFTDIRSIVVEPTLVSPDKTEEVKSEAQTTAREIAQSV